MDLVDSSVRDIEELDREEKPPQKKHSAGFWVAMAVIAVIGIALLVVGAFAAKKYFDVNPKSGKIELQNTPGDTTTLIQTASKLDQKTIDNLNYFKNHAKQDFLTRDEMNCIDNILEFYKPSNPESGLGNYLSYEKLQEYARMIMVKEKHRHFMFVTYPKELRLTTYITLLTQIKDTIAKDDNASHLISCLEKTIDNLTKKNALAPQ